MKPWLATIMQVAVQLLVTANQFIHHRIGRQLDTANPLAVYNFAFTKRN